MRGRLACVVLAVIASAVLAGAAVEPMFPAVAVISLDDGSAVNLASFRGRPVLMTFWASWCAPCRLEMPELKHLYDELAGRGFIFLPVTMDDSNAAALEFLAKAGLALPVYRMSDRDLRTVGVRALPTSFLIDPDGRAVQVYQGYSPGMAGQVRARVLEMLGPTGTATP
jgi:thiol-disulfide isomerase/thioredoxin